MIQYRMETDSDCGPAALACILQRPLSEIKARWPGGWRGDDRGRFGMPNDTPYDHFALLADLGQPFRIVTCQQILHKQVPAKKTMVLIHAKGLIGALLSQHWAIVHGWRVQDGVNYVELDWGDGQIKLYPFNTFEKAYSRGWPACAYAVDEGNYRLSRWQRFVAWLTGRFV